MGFLLLASVLAAQGAAVGAPAPDFGLRTLVGDSVRLSALRGRPVLVNFWASWCDPCRSEMPEIAAAYARHRETGLEVLAVNLRDQERERDVRRFVAELALPFPVLLDDKGRTRRRYRLGAIPTSVFIDTAGVIRVVHPGPMTAEVLNRALDEILPRR
ncbi:MAG: TlpA family protein disulfide reductase [Anaerolineales bacterium]